MEGFWPLLHATMARRGVWDSWVFFLYDCWPLWSPVRETLNLLHLGQERVGTCAGTLFFRTCDMFLLSFALLCDGTSFFFNLTVSSQGNLWWTDIYVKRVSSKSLSLFMVSSKNLS